MIQIKPNADVISVNVEKPKLRMVRRGHVGNSRSSSSSSTSSLSLNHIKGVCLSVLMRECNEHTTS